MKSTRPFHPTPVITIDGPTASGKGTVAALVAAHLGFHLLDSGALYRLAALASVRYGIAAEDIDALVKLIDDLHITFREGCAQLDGVDVSNDIRAEAVATAHRRLPCMGRCAPRSSRVSARSARRRASLQTGATWAP
ncbi:Cytidylate kinase [Burkholderia cepacia]|nr:Cytidylate kinase [Burkholderia cepacia]